MRAPLEPHPHIGGRCALFRKVGHSNLEKSKRMDVTTAIRSLAAQVSSANEERVPYLLLKLREILNNSRLDSRARKGAYHLVWKNDLIHVMVGVTRRDFSQFPSGWATAAQLAELMATVCSGLGPQESHQRQQQQQQLPGWKDPKKKGTTEAEESDHVKELYEMLLPTAVDSLLILANSLLEHESAPAPQKPKPASRTRSNANSTLQTFQSILISLSKLCSAHRQCAFKTIQSPYVLSMIISNQPQHCLAVVTTLNHLLATDEQLFASVPEDHLPTVLDVLAYKLTTSDEIEELQIECLKLLAAFIEHNLDMLPALCAKYGSLPGVATRLESRGLGEKVELLVENLALCAQETRGVDERDGDVGVSGLQSQVVDESDRSIATHTETTRSVETVLTVNRAATIIQASWRGYADRLRLKRMMDRRVGKFQLQYHPIATKQKERNDFAMCRRDVAVTKRLQGLSEMRTFHEKQMSLLEQLPAGEVASFLHNQQISAATRIQACWRGRMERERYQKRKEHARLVAGVVVIQRAMRRFLKRKGRGRQLQPSVPGYPKVEGQEREQLLRETAKYREENPPPQSSEAQLRQTHDEVQRLLSEFYLCAPEETRKAERRKLSLSNLERDCSLLLAAPRLSDVRDEQIEAFSSGSRAVAVMARQAHREELRAMELPWWKQPQPEGRDNILPL